MKAFLKKHEKVVVLSLLSIVLIIILGYWLSLKRQQIKHTTYHVGTVKKVTPYQGKGIIKSNSIYTKKIPEKAQLNTGLAAEQQVKKGEVLGTLTFPEKESQLQELQAKISSLQTQLATIQQESLSSQNMANIDLTTPSQATNEKKGNEATELQAIQAELAQNQQSSVKQKISSLQQQLDELNAQEQELSEQSQEEVTAPFDGICKIKESQGQPEKFIVYSQNKVLEAKVGQDNYTQVSPDAKINLKNSVLDETQQKKISVVSELPTKQKGTVKPAYKFITAVNEDFLTGQVVSFTVPQKGLQIPNSAVKKKHVYLIQGDDKAQSVKVEGRKMGRHFIVSSGLNAGDKVVTDRNNYLHTGVKVHQAE